MKKNCIKNVIKAALFLVLPLAMAAVGCSKTEKPVEAEKGLKDYFKDKFLVGAALNEAQTMGKDTQAIELVLKNFNTITAENAMKWERIHPKPGVYNFTIPDSLVAFGQRHGMFIVGHCLVWHSQTPDWVFQDAKGKLVCRDTLLKRMKDHIFTVVGRYKGKVGGWDVVNEAVDDNGQMRQSKWYQIIGEDYVQKAFEYAHEADSTAQLYYNDYNIELKGKREGAIKLIKDLQAKGIKVYAVGIQGHWHLDRPAISEIDSSFQAFTALGVKIMITEFEVNVIPEPQNIVGAEISQRAEYKKEMNPWPESFPDSMQQVLAKRYADLFRVFEKKGNEVIRVTFWGVQDGDSWKNNWPIPGRTNYPLLFDRKFQPKPAYFAVIKTVEDSTQAGVK